MSGATLLDKSDDWIDTPSAQRCCKAIIEAIGKDPRQSFLALGEYMRTILQIAASPMDTCSRVISLIKLDDMVDGDAENETEGSELLRQVYILATLAHFHRADKK